MESCDLFIIGGGAAGLSACRAAAESGCKDILLADRGEAPGGILRQCLHLGFGPELSGPAYIRSLMEGFPAGVRFLQNTHVLSIGADRTAVLSSPDFGLKKIGFGQLILATGCMETGIGSLQIPGTRPQGIYTAGQLQRDMNLNGFVPKGPAVILGSGDMGLLAARRLIDAGVEIKMLVEKAEQCGGLARNRDRLAGEALELRCGCTISEIFGEKWLEGVSVRDEKTGAAAYVPCRTLVVAIGMTPQRELIKSLNAPPWLTLCGNCSSIHPVVEGVVQEGLQAGRAACENQRGKI